MCNHPVSVCLDLGRFNTVTSSILLVVQALRLVSSQRPFSSGINVKTCRYGHVEAEVLQYFQGSTRPLFVVIVSPVSRSLRPVFMGCKCLTLDTSRLQC